jgi:hypothetical protein
MVILSGILLIFSRSFLTFEHVVIVEHTRPRKDRTIVENGKPLKFAESNVHWINFSSLLDPQQLNLKYVTCLIGHQLKNMA